MWQRSSFTLPLEAYAECPNRFCLHYQYWDDKWEWWREPLVAQRGTWNKHNECECWFPLPSAWNKVFPFAKGCKLIMSVITIVSHKKLKIIPWFQFQIQTKMNDKHKHYSYTNKLHIYTKVILMAIENANWNWYWRQTFLEAQ